MLELERLLFYRYRHWHCNYISASIASISLLGKITVNLVHVLFAIFTTWIYCLVRMILQRWMKLRFWNDITTFLIKSVENNNRDLPFARSFFLSFSDCNWNDNISERESSLITTCLRLTTRNWEFSNWMPFFSPSSFFFPIRSHHVNASVSCMTE